MLSIFIVLFGATLNIFGTATYLIATIKGKVKPNRVSWFLWSLAPLIAFAAEAKQGVGIIGVTTLVAGLNPLAVFLASFVNKKSQWKLGYFDFICGGLSIFGLILWGITREGNIAIIFSILADFLASLPTVVKSYHAPETESAFAFYMSALSAAAALIVAPHWTLAYIGFPMYLFLDCIVVIFLIQSKIGKKF